MSDYRKSELAKVLDHGEAVQTRFYRLVVMADNGMVSKHLNISGDELAAIRDLLECQHGSGTYVHVGRGPDRSGTYCRDCDVKL